MRLLRFVVVSFLLYIPAALSGLSTITIINSNGPGQGFNDPTPATPVGNNPGTTVGAQRLFAFRYAAETWAQILPSNIEIQVNAKFDPLPCAATGGVLGAAGPSSMWRDFPNTLLPNHWYHSALANKLANMDISAAQDIDITFNSGLGTAACLPMGWYYGVDGREGSQIELLPVVLHELAHGLGFSTPTNGYTGNYASGYPSAFDHYVLDKTSGLHWDENTPAQRAASAVSVQNLVWDGGIVVRAVPNILSDKVVLKVNAPTAIAGNYEVGIAAFGPPSSTVGVTGNVVLVNDGVGVTTDGCETPFANGVQINGKIALIDRGGTCTFAIKVWNAQNSGAIAVIIADNVVGSVPEDMGGSDGRITIPSVRITLADGNTLKSALGSGLNVKIFRDPQRKTGADSQNRVMLYAPTQFAGGSSISHWSTFAVPDLLMEPALTSSASSNVDLTASLFADIGWFGSVAPPPPDTQAPTAPSNLLATIFSSSQINLSWTASTDNLGVTGYNIYRSTVSGTFSSTPTATATTTSYSDTGLAASTTYYYQVKGRDAAGNVSSASNQVSSDTGIRTAKIIAPISGETVYGTVTIKASANISGGVGRVEFFKAPSYTSWEKPANLIGTDTTAPYELNWNTTNDSNGGRVIGVVAYPATGGSVVYYSHDVIVNNLPLPPPPPTAPLPPQDLKAWVSGESKVLVAWRHNNGPVDLRTDTFFIRYSQRICPPEGEELRENDGYTQSRPWASAFSLTWMVIDNLEVGKPYCMQVKAAHKLSNDTYLESAPTNLLQVTTVPGVRFLVDKSEIPYQALKDFGYIEPSEGTGTVNGLQKADISLNQQHPSVSSFFGGGCSSSSVNFSSTLLWMFILLMGMGRNFLRRANQGI